MKFAQPPVLALALVPLIQTDSLVLTGMLRILHVRIFGLDS
jgi:hypothetical protein